MKEEPVHKDLLGRPIKLGDVVAYAQSNTLCVGTVDKLNPKMIRVKPFRGSWGSNKYSSDCAILEGEAVTFHLLKNG